MAYMSILGIALTILLLLVSTTLWLVTSRKSPKLPPGRVGWLIIGESLEFMPSPEQFMRDRMNKYSPKIFKTSIAGEKMTILCGASGNKFFYSNEAHLTTWVPKPIAKLLAIEPNYNTSQSWKIFDLILHKMLKLDSMAAYVSTMDLKCREHIDKYWVPYDEVKVQPLAKEFTFALSCYLFLDYTNLEQVEDLAEPYFTLVKGIMAVPVNIPGTTFYRAMRATKAVLHKLEEIIRERKIEVMRRRDEGKIDGEDLLSKLLMGLSEDGNVVDEKDVAQRLVSLLFASFHTTANAITCVLHFLAEYPQVYDRVLQEHSEIINSKAKGEPLSWKDIQKMKYSWLVVCESMRLVSPSLGGFREVKTDFTYEGYIIPKGWKVHWSVHTTHKDPKNFPDPEKFDPSRFEHNLPPGAFVPFGGGPHMCCGKEFARIFYTT